MHRIGVRHRRNEAKIDAAQEQHVLLFLALRLGHDDDRAIAAGVADQSEANAGIAGGAFDDNAARTQQPALLGILDDKESGAILDGAAGVQKLGLAEDRATGLLGGAPQFDQGRVSDSADKTVANLHPSLRILGRPIHTSATAAGKEHKI
jgi:hypothetical protein